MEIKGKKNQIWGDTTIWMVSYYTTWHTQHDNYFLILFHFVCFADTKNSVGLVGCIEEVSHNAIAVYWNPLESSAKVRKHHMHWNNTEKIK